MQAVSTAASITAEVLTFAADLLRRVPGVTTPDQTASPPAGAPPATTDAVKAADPPPALPPPGAPPTPPMQVQADKVVDDLHATATTIIKLLTAVAAIIVAGTSFSNLGKLTGPDWMEEYRLQIAFATGGLALATIGFVIWQATRVLTKGAVALNDLANPGESKANRRLAEYALRMGVTKPDETTIQLFLDKRITAMTEREATSETHHVLERREIEAPNDPALGVAVKQAKLDLDRSASELNEISVRTRLMTAGLRARIIGQTMKEAAVLMTIAGVIGGISLGGFVWAANPPDGEPEPFLTPVEVIVALSDEEAGRYGARLGAACVADEFRAIVLSVADDTAHLVSLASPTCRVAEIYVSLDSIHPAGTNIPTPAASPAAATPTPVASPSAPTA